MIKLQQVNKYFNKGKSNQIHVLNDVSIDLPEKGLVVFLGESGSGKTTLLNVIGGLDKIGSGKIYFDNKEISKFNVTKWDELRNETIGYIFQNYYLQPQLSVFDNVAFVLRMLGISDQAEIEKRVNYVLKALGMYEFRKKRGLQLSGGQQQRVAIARALVKNPNIIIADEPTGNLDSKNTTEIMNIIKEIAKEKLVLLVTHDRDLAKFYANRIVEIVDGKMVKDYENIQSDDHGLVDDQVIYLKDLEKVSSISDENINISLFSDSSVKEPVDVKLIFKNNTLYLKVENKIDKIKLANDHDGIKILDAHYVKKTREQLLETTYDTSVLDHSNIHKEHKFVISTKRNIKLAIAKVLSFGRKGKLMLSSFVLAGMVIAFALAMLFTAVTFKPNSIYNKNDNEVSIKNELPEFKFKNYFNNFDEFKGFIKTDNIIIKNIQLSSGFYQNNTLARLSLNIPQFSNQNIGVTGNIALLEATKPFKLISGQSPKENNEILISKGVAKTILNNDQGFFGSMTYSGNDFGIWDYKDILLEDYFVDILGKKLDVKISGITNEELYVIYLNKDFYESAFVDMGYASFEQAVMESQSVIAMLDNNSTIFNDNPNNINVINLYDEAIRLEREEKQIILPSVLPLVAVFIGFTVIGYYFVIRSSMISRIQEIGIYRALGVKRIEILSMFFYEIIVLTTISTLIGYLIGSIFVKLLTSSLIGALNYFEFNSISFTLGFILVYGINIISGLLPVITLVRKTPAQILTQYDI